VRILRCENDAYCYEAKRLFETMPHWIPGKNYGKETAVKMVIPINLADYK